MEKKYFVLAVFSFLFSHFLTSQIEWKSYSSGNNVTGLALYGNTLWVATNGDGLVKVNTLTGDTKIFQKINSGITSDIIYHIAVDKNGSVLLNVAGLGSASTSEFELLRFDGDSTWTRLSGNNDIRKIAVDPSNNIWLACFDGIYKIKGNTLLKLPGGLPSEQFNAIAFDEKGNQWLGSGGHLIKYRDSTIVASYDKNDWPPLSSDITALVCEKDTVWIGTDNGLMKFDGSNWTAWRPGNSNLSTGIVAEMAIDTAHNLWMANYTGLSKFDRKQFTNYSDTTKFRASTVRSVCVTNDGRKWIGTTEEGVFIFDTSFVKQNTSNSPLPTAISINMSEDTHGTKWFASIYARYGITSFDGNNWKYYTPQNSLFTAYESSDVCSDSVGNTWCQTPYGLFKYDGSKWQKYDYPAGIGGGKIAIVNGTLWFGGYKNIASFDGTKWTTYPQQYGGGIYNPTADKKGNIWYTSNIGLYRFDGVNFTNYHTQNSGILSNTGHDICVDKFNNVWIATNLGLSKFDGVNWTNYTTSNSKLPESNIYNITVDDKNVLWISTYLNLTRFDGTNWLSFNQSNSPVMWPRRISIDRSGNKWISLAYCGFLFMKGDAVLSVTDTKTDKTTVQVYPNPTQDEAVVSFKNNPNHLYTFTLYTIDGKVVKTLENISTSEFKINIEHFSKGTYIYKLSSKNELIGTGQLVIP